MNGKENQGVHEIKTINHSVLAERKPMVLVPERSFKHSLYPVMYIDPSRINIVTATFFTSLEESL